MNDKLYVVVRRDLTHAQRAVQAGHALAEYLLKDSTSWSNGTLVYLGVSGEDDLYRTYESLDDWGFDPHSFREPDMEDQMTAIACLGSNKILKRIPLL